MRWAAGWYIIASAILLGAIKGSTPGRWWRRVKIERELRRLARTRRRTRQAFDAACAGHPSAYGGREAAAVALALVDLDEQIDQALDRLDALS